MADEQTTGFAADSMPDKSSPAGKIIGHLRSIMNNGDWDFHGNGIVRVVNENISKAIALALVDTRQAITYGPAVQVTVTKRQRRKKGQS